MVKKVLRRIWKFYLSILPFNNIDWISPSEVPWLPLGVAGGTKCQKHPLPSTLCYIWLDRWGDFQNLYCGSETLGMTSEELGRICGVDGTRSRVPRMRIAQTREREPHRCQRKYQLVVASLRTCIMLIQFCIHNFAFSNMTCSI